jgi:hypothetical protein
MILRVTATKRRSLILAGSAVGLILLLAFFTNPDQAAHLRAIKETAALRQPNGSAVLFETFLPAVKYNDYLFFSTATWASKPMTYGYFGQVRTTNRIEMLWGVFK